MREHVLGEEELDKLDKLQDDHDPVGRPLLRHQQPPPGRRTGEQRDLILTSRHRRMPVSEMIFSEPTCRFDENAKTNTFFFSF